MRFPPPLSESEIARRIRLWQALAALYLDTESEHFVANILDVARDGGFSLPEVEHILRWEVRPTLYTNYLSVAGEWAGWEDDWLRDRIVEAIAKPPLFCRWPLRWVMRNWLMPDPEWREIQAAMASATPSVSSIQPPPSTRSPS